MNLEKTKNFIFADGFTHKEGAFNVRLSPEIYNKHTLLTALHYQCWFPTYNGMNWDALSDLLCNFEWIDEEDIYIIHKSLPELDDRELCIYIAILSDATVYSVMYADSVTESTEDDIEMWGLGRGSKNLFVVFPTEAKERVAYLLDLADKLHRQGSQEN